MLAAGLMLGACSTPAIPAEDAVAAYVGSESCADCHQDIYSRWQDTLMANVLQDPAENPEIVLGDFSTPNPLVTFDIDDVAFTYGSKWKQRYFTQVGDDYFVQPAQWDVANQNWRSYNPGPGGDWWVEHYPPDQMSRPTGPLCDGCHSVNYDIQTRTPTEWNVGCEACHGAGSLHVEFPIADTILNPDDLDHVRSDDVCIQCHSQGQPRQIPHPETGGYYDWPVGYQPGDRLADVWKLEEHVLGAETFAHWPEGSAHKNRMQGNDYVQGLMYAREVRCSGCHDVHGTEFEADLRFAGNAVCTQCHTPQLQPGPRGTLEQHTQHAAGSTGSECIACHMPEIARTVADVNVRSHTFRFISPADTERYGIPNPCISCHTDQTNDWAMEALREWPNVSPWRVGE